MTSTIELDRPMRNSSARRRRRRWGVGLAVTAGVLVTTAATGAAYVVSHAGNRPLPAGPHPVEVYTVDDALSTPAERPGVIGRFLGMCDADSYYFQVRGAGMCVVLNGSLGTVRATGTGDGAGLDAGQAARVRDIVREADRGGAGRTTRVVLGYDGGWAGMLPVTGLDAGGAVTASRIG